MAGCSSCGGGSSITVNSGGPRDLGAGIVQKYSFTTPDGTETIHDTFKQAANARAASPTGGVIGPKAVKIIRPEIAPE